MPEATFTMTGSAGKQLDDRGVRRITAAYLYLVAWHGIDGARPYPGTDLPALRAYSTGDLLDQVNADARMPVRSQDKAVLDDINRRSGGRFIQTVSVRDAVYDEASEVVAITFDVTNQLQDEELIEEGWWVRTKRCETNPTDWCVTAWDNAAEGDG